MVKLRDRPPRLDCAVLFNSWEGGRELLDIEDDDEEAEEAAAEGREEAADAGGEVML